MGARAVRRLERSMEVEPVVSYSLIPPEGAGKKTEDDGRVEPRLTVLPMERRQRSAEIMAPTSEDAALHGTRFEATPLDPLPPEARKRRRRLPVFVIGLAALFVAFGVLAATFGKVMTGGGVTAIAPTDETPSVSLAPPPPATEETAGPGVRIIPPDGNATAATEAPASAAPGDAAAAAQTAALPSPAETSAAPANPPLPRLRPTGAGASVASGMPAPSATTDGAAPASADSDVNALMSDVDRILTQHRAVNPEPAPLPPPPTGTAEAGAPLVMTSPAPLETVAPPAPQRRGWFLYPVRNTGGLPVPPADIPDPEGAPGQ
ncbi:MAG TPA: hypothetical protein VHA70_06050 [Bauldia sp.]|nr:hypothetical protein [Bauldia sp.]